MLRKAQHTCACSRPTTRGQVAARTRRRALLGLLLAPAASLAFAAGPAAAGEPAQSMLGAVATTASEPLSAVAHDAQLPQPGPPAPTGGGSGDATTSPAASGPAAEPTTGAPSPMTEAGGEKPPARSEARATPQGDSRTPSRQAQSGPALAARPGLAPRLGRSAPAGPAQQAGRSTMHVLDRAMHGARATGDGVGGEPAVGSGPRELLGRTEALATQATKRLPLTAAALEAASGALNGLGGEMARLPSVVDEAASPLLAQLVSQAGPSTTPLPLSGGAFDRPPSLLPPPGPGDPALAPVGHDPLALAPRPVHSLGAGSPAAAPHSRGTAQEPRTPAQVTPAPSAASSHSSTSPSLRSSGPSTWAPPSPAPGGPISSPGASAPGATAPTLLALACLLLLADPRARRRLRLLGARLRPAPFLLLPERPG